MPKSTVCSKNGSVALTPLASWKLSICSIYAANDLKVSKWVVLEVVIWPFRMMLTTSIPAKVLWADSNSLNPVQIDILRLILRWSCSTILFRYLQLLRLIRLKLLLFTVLIASELAPLLSMLITRGLPLFPIALLRNFWAEPFILRLVSRKSTV